MMKATRERQALAMRQLASPNRESFHLGIARSAYIEDHISVDEYERSVEHVLQGGTLDEYGRIRDTKTIMLQSGMATLNELRQ